MYRSIPRLLSVVLLLTASALHAATPADGTLTDTSGPLTFTGGPNLVPNPTPFAHSSGTPLVCQPELTNCERFALTVAIPEKFRKDDKNKKEVVQIVVEFAGPAPPAATDYDIYLFDGSGEEIGSSVSDAGVPEVITLPLSVLKDGSYTVEIYTFTPFGASYNGEVRLGRGKKSAEADTESRSGSGLALGAFGFPALFLLLGLALLHRRPQ